MTLCFLLSIYKDDATEMTVTWVTPQRTNSSIAEYGKATLNPVTKGSEVEFVDGGKAKRKFYVHKVIMTNLDPGKNYSELHFN